MDCLPFCKKKPPFIVDMSTDGILRFQNTKKATFVGPTSNISFDTVNSSLGIGVTGDDVPSSNLYITGNAYVSSNLALGGVLTMGTVNVVARHSLQAVTEIGNTTSLTTEFTNPTTSLVASGNVEINGQTTFSGHIIPTLDATYDVGTPEKRVREVFVSNNSLWIGDRAKISFVRGRMVFKHRKLKHIPSMVRQIALDHGRQNETEIEQEVIEHAQTVDPNVSTLEDIRIEHWRDYTKSMDETKEITDIFADNDEDYEAVAAADAFKEIGSNIFTTHSLSIGKETEPTAPLDVNGTIKATSFEGTATNTVQIRLTESTGANTSYRVPFAAGSSGNQTLHTDAGLTYNPSTNKLNTTASSATVLQNARNINGVSFDGSADITVNGTRYNINDSWLRYINDSNYVRLYGNSRSMVFRTDGNTQYGSNGGYPFVWLYGGDATGNRRMLLNTSGQLWCSNYGWLHDKFAPKHGSNSNNFYANRSYADDWFRAQGSCGIYWESYGGGWYMRDSTYIRNYNNKMLLIQGSGARIYGAETSYDYPNHLHDWWTNGGQIQADAPYLHFGLYMQYAIRAPQYVAFSDRRIKKEISEIDDNVALQKLRGLKPSMYNYKEENKNRTEKVIGFIAQEVKEIIPNAVSVSDGEIPNIYETAIISDGNAITFTNFNTSNLEESNNTLIVYITPQERKEVEIIEIVNEHTIRVNEDISEWGRSYDENGKLIFEEKIINVTPEEFKKLEDKMDYKPVISGYSNGEITITKEEYEKYNMNGQFFEVISHYEKIKKVYKGSELFVWGQKIKDFHNLDKNAIFTIATAALQEVDRQQQADKARITELETQLASVLVRLDALENA